MIKQCLQGSMSHESMRGLKTHSIHAEENDEDEKFSSSSSYVQMIELVTSYHTMDTGGIIDVKFLLQFMDICTCAAAEKHTGVNCVTVSMGDVVFEYLPKCGDMLEFTARPVYVGRTSLDIDLLVIVDLGDGESRRIVCNASFTYVTTKGPNGEKRLCPPLSSSDNMDWLKTVAKYRRELIKAEKKSSFPFSDQNCYDKDSSFLLKDNKKNKGKEGKATQKFDLIMTELILPAHQNHMDHTFGGIIMGWMAKAALATAARKSKHRVGSLFVYGILRVDFQCGSGVSDHIIFSSRLNAISDDGVIAEIEVQAMNRSIDTKQETPLNVGYFYIAHIDTIYSSSKKSTGTLFNSPSAITLNASSTKDEKRKRNEERLAIITKQRKEDAENRYRLFLARKRLLSGVGNVVEWNPILHDVAPILTISSVLRLATGPDSSLSWNDIVIPNRNNKDTFVNKVEWISGKALGRLANTVVIRAEGILRSTKSNKKKVFTVASVLDDIKLNRPDWDHTCGGIEILEGKQQHNRTDEGDDDIQWDVVKHRAKIPKRLSMTQNKKKMKSIFKKEKEYFEVPFIYLRAWKLQSSGDSNNKNSKPKKTEKPIKNEAIIACQSVHHPGYKNPKSISNVEVLPSGWFIQDIVVDATKDEDDATVDDSVEVTLKSNNNRGGIALTYIVEYDLAQLRTAGVGVSSTNKDDHDDTILRQFLGAQIYEWFRRLAHHDVDYSA